MWGVGAHERHREAPAVGDVVLAYVGGPVQQLVARAELGSVAHRWTPSEARRYPGFSRGGVLLREIERWDPPVPMSLVLSRVDPAENARAELDTGVVRIAAGEHDAAIGAAAGNRRPRG